MESGLTSSVDRLGKLVPPRLFGDYELLEMIGRGGMGIVYKARQRNLNRVVALKMVLNWREATRDTLARFTIEAEAAAMLNHPHIVPLYQIGDLDGQPFFSMKLVSGQSLAKKRSELVLLKPEEGVSAKSSRRPAREAQVIIATLLAKVARAVHFAHQHGVIHRDLKPTNILIDAEGEPHLTDFGVAKLLDQDHGLTQTDDVLGTPAYMAPEQASGKSITAAVDIYSLGAILYQLLTGQPPFQGRTPLETLHKVIKEEPVTPAVLNRNADVELVAICLKCLEKDRMNRYESALGVAEDLERWIRREPILAKRASPVARTVRWTRRNPLGASLIGTLCLGLTVSLVLLGLLNRANIKTMSVLKDVEMAGRTNAQLLSITVSLLHDQLEGLWLSPDRRVLQIRSDQLAALSGLPIHEVPRNLQPERIRFGLSANESPVSDSRRYALFLSYLENRLSERRQHPVRIDLHIYKYKEDRTEALVTGNLDLARMGTVYYLRTKQQHPQIQALVEMESSQKSGVFFTRINSGIRTLGDLRGKRIAFGDSTSSVTFWGQAKLADAGIMGKSFGEYIFLDSRSDFIEEAHELGPAAALKRKRWLHSTADVIEEVLSGRFDAGVTTENGYAKHHHPGLVRIPGSEFLRRPSPWVARGDFPADLARDLVAVFTEIHDNEFLLLLPDRPSGFSPITEATHAQEREAMERIERLFPISSPSTNEPVKPTPQKGPTQ